MRTDTKYPIELARGSVDTCFDRLDQVWEDQLRQEQTTVLVDFPDYDLDQLDARVEKLRAEYVAKRAECLATVLAAIEKKHRESAEADQR